MAVYNFQNAEGDETRTKKLNLLKATVDAGVGGSLTLPLASLAMVATPPVVQATIATYTKVTVMDTVVVQRGAISASATTDDITTGVIGTYEVSPSINVASAASSELVFGIFVDGVLSGEEVYLQGLGATKPVFAGGTHFMQLSAGQVLDIRVKSATSADASFFSCTLAIKQI